MFGNDPISGFVPIFYSIIFNEGGSDMNNTALRVGLLSASGTCSATTVAKRRPQSADNTHMVFANEEHEKFYGK